VRGAANTIDRVKIHADGETEIIDLGQNPNNMVAELEAFVEIIEAGDSNQALKLLDHTATVMKFLEAARKSSGIRYPADEKGQKEGSSHPGTAFFYGITCPAAL